MLAVDDRSYRDVAQAAAEQTIESARSTAAHDVPEDRHPGFDVFLILTRRFTKLRIDQ